LGGAGAPRPFFFVSNAGHCTRGGWRIFRPKKILPTQHLVTAVAVTPYQVEIFFKKQFVSSERCNTKSVEGEVYKVGRFKNEGFSVWAYLPVKKTKGKGSLLDWKYAGRQRWRKRNLSCDGRFIPAWKEMGFSRKQVITSRTSKN